LRIEKNDLKSVTLLEAKSKVKDIAISRERITLKDVLQEGIYYLKNNLIKKFFFIFPSNVNVPYTTLVEFLILK
jgi:hypothetical protein